MLRPAARRLARAQPHVACGMVSETLTPIKKSKKAAAMQREFVSDEDFEFLKRPRFTATRQVTAINRHSFLTGVSCKKNNCLLVLPPSASLLI